MSAARNLLPADAFARTVFFILVFGWYALLIILYCGFLWFALSNQLIAPAMLGPAAFGIAIALIAGCLRGAELLIRWILALVPGKAWVTGSASDFAHFTSPKHHQPSSVKGTDMIADTPLARFHALFGPGSQDRPGLPRSLRQQVFVRMQHAFAETDGRKFRRVKTHFLKTFHPDTVGSVFTPTERHAVFVTIPEIFKTEDAR